MVPQFEMGDRLANVTIASLLEMFAEDPLKRDCRVEVLDAPRIQRLLKRHRLGIACLRLAHNGLESRLSVPTFGPMGRPADLNLGLVRLAHGLYTLVDTMCDRERAALAHAKLRRGHVAVSHLAHKDLVAVKDVGN